jgi:hypothetical protein
MAGFGMKMIKRQMFGRAGLPLLRKRVLLTARNRLAPAAVSITKMGARSGN